MDITSTWPPKGPLRNVAGFVVVVEVVVAAAGTRLHLCKSRTCKQNK